jgi:serine phosphatase RsbU (regulator of sigma subunit)
MALRVIRRLRAMPVSLSVKLLVISELVLLVSVLAILLPVRQAMRNQIVNDLQAQLRAIAVTAALHIDGDLHQTIRAPADAATPAFATLRGQLRQIRDANGLANEHIYTFYADPDGRTVRFAVMPHDQPFVGNAYPLRALMLPVLLTGKTMVTDLYRDPNGEWISAYAPITNSGGRIVGLLEVDKPAADYFRSYRVVTLLSVALGVLVLAIASLLGWWVLNRTVLRPMRAVHRGMLALARQDFSHQVRLDTRDEFEDLGKTLNHLSRELNVARRVQRSFNPTMLPQSHGWRIAGESEPADATAGDYFDAFELGDASDGRIAVVIADVSGHGLGPALLMSAARSALRVVAKVEPSPARVIDRLDALLEPDLVDGRFITMLYGVLSPDGTFVYRNAGHAPALVARCGDCAGGTPRVEPLDSHRPPLGVGLIDFGSEESTVHLNPGDRIVLASDGTVEAMDAKGDQFGDARLHAIVADPSIACAAVPAKLRAALTLHVGGPQRKDDVTILLIDRAPAAAPDPTTRNPALAATV